MRSGLRQIVRHGQSRMARFGAASGGIQSLEMLVWTVFFLQLSLLVLDVTHLHWRHAEMWTVARDAARQTAMGAVEPTQAAVENVVPRRLDPGYEAVFSSFPNATHTVTVRTDVEDLALIGFLDLAFETVSASVTMAQEIQ